MAATFCCGSNTLHSGWAIFFFISFIASVASHTSSFSRHRASLQPAFELFFLAPVLAG